ncbi:MAG: hypothetical protein GY923_00845, partial [Aestuariibacter sp.]|nr:hypothetical protein [Aestuariibacter sp.]
MNICRMIMVRLSTSILLVTGTLLVLSGCGSTPTTRSTPTRTAPTETVTQREVSEQPLSPEALIELAQQQWQSDGDNRNSLEYLIQAAQQWQSSGEPVKSQQVLYSLRHTPLPTNLKARYNLLLAQQYADDPKVSSEQVLTLLNGNLSDDALRRQQFALKAQQYARLGQWLQAANALLKSTDITPDVIAQTWEWVNHASEQDEVGIARLTEVAPFVALKQLVRENGFDQSQ